MAIRPKLSVSILTYVVSYHYVNKQLVGLIFYSRFVLRVMLYITQNLAGSLSNEWTGGMQKLLGVAK